MRFTTKLISTIFCLLFGLNISQAQCDGTSDIIQNSTNLALSTTTIINVGMGSSFTPTCTGPIEGVSLWTYQVPGSIGQTSVTVELHSNPFNSSSRTLVSSVTTDIPYQNEGSLERYFQFSDTPTLTAGVEYSVRLINNVQHQLIDMELHTGNLLPNGNMFVRDFDQSSPWSTRDLRFQVHYIDEVAPVANCRNITRSLGADDTVSISANNVNNGSSDADSGIATRFVNPSTFDCNDIGENTVTLTVTDQNGNTGTCEAIVTILDGNDPVLTCPGDRTVYTDPGVPVTVNYNDVVYSDCTIETPSNFSLVGVWDGKSYFVSNYQEIPEFAFAAAEALGGHLATVLDQDHNDFLRSAVPTAFPLLIGYNDLSEEGNFEWHSGASSTYTNWAPGEPNNSNNEDYTIIGSDGQWNDVRNTSGARRFVIELSQSPITQTAGFPSGSTFPLGETTNTFEATDGFGNTGTCSFTITVVENPFETLVDLTNGKLSITDIENDSDDQITISNDGATLTISNLVLPTVSGGPLLTDATTVTVPLANITAGIEFVGGNGNNSISIADAITLTGANNGISLSGLTTYTQSGNITIGGSFTITESPNASVTLKGLIAESLNISNVDILADAASEIPINISGTTTIQANTDIAIRYGDDAPHSFNGVVSLDSNFVEFTNTGDTSLGTINITETSDIYNGFISVGSGGLNLTGDIITAGDSDLRLKVETTITQSGGRIVTDLLSLDGNDNETSTASFLSANNDINTLETFTNESFAQISLNDMDDVELGAVEIDNIAVTASTIRLTENTLLTKNSSDGNAIFTGNIELTTTGADPATILHNRGLIEFNGTTIDLVGNLEYIGIDGTDTRFIGDTTIDTQISPIFDILYVEGTCTVDVLTNIIYEAHFNGASTIVKGKGTLTGSALPITVENGATITPGIIGDVATLAFHDLIISSASYAPTIESNDDYDRIEVGTITLTNASLSPTGGYVSQPTDEALLLIDNTGTDPINGTFNNLPEGSQVTVGDYSGIISYVGGDGNDVTLTHLETEVSLAAGKLTIIDLGGATDDDITFSNNGTTLTISNLAGPVFISGGPVLTEPTTVTVPLANITNGIELLAAGGTNTITISNTLTLPGASNSLTLSGIDVYAQNAALTIDGGLTIIGNDTGDINLAEVTARSLTINGFVNINDSSDKITIAETTNLTASNKIDIDNGQNNHEFNGPISVEADQIFFMAGATTTFNNITTTSSSGKLNAIITLPGNIVFDGNVTISGNGSNFDMATSGTVTQTSGIISVDFLILRGNNSSVVTLNQANSVKALAVENPFNVSQSAFTNLIFNSTRSLFLETVNIDGATLTAPQFDLEPDFTVITKTGTGTANFNADMDVNNGTGTVLINHTEGTINFNGETNDFLSQFTYNGAAGTITNINSDTTSFPSVGANRSFTFGFLNASGNIDMNDSQINILNTAAFTGSNTLATGTPTISGGPTVIENNATLTPGGGLTFAMYTTNDLIITSGGTYAPLVQGTNISAHDQIAVVGTVTLANGVLAPLGGYPIQAGDEIIIIDNDGTDPVVGTFANLPEGGGVSFGTFSGMVSYTGGDGNDVVLVPDTINPIAVCQDLSIAIGLDGIEVTADQIAGGSTDNLEIASIVINGEASVHYTYEDLGANTVDITVTDTSGNTAICSATITLTSNVTFPIVISEYQPQPTPSNLGALQTIEIKGAAGEAFVGVLVIIDGDESRNGRGSVTDVANISGTFDANGILTASVPNFTDPSHTAVLTSAFTGQAGSTDIDSDDDAVADDITAFGTIFDAVGVRDGGACCPVSVQYGTDFGGVNLVNIGEEPAAVFRIASTGDFFQLKADGTIRDSFGAVVDPSLFDTTPTVDGTFGQINPTVSLDMNAEAFMTTWKTDNPGSSADNQITIFTDTNETYNYVIDWGDGTSDLNVSGNITHTYDTAGTYTVSILGTFPRFISNGSFSGNSLKLLSIDQWGSIAWSSFENAFEACKNMNVIATDMPDLTNVTSLTSMFFDCTSLVGTTAISNWNVSNVTTMVSMFQDAAVFNQDLNNWNTNQVQNMSFMFADATNFNGNISSWNVSSVTDMSLMFLNAEAFNQDLNSWNPSLVKNMNFMFTGATSFNGNISNWNTEEVLTMLAMFQDAAAFNQNISGWNVTSVTEMSNLFAGATSFNQDLNSWNTGQVNNMGSMFEGATSFNGDISNWNVTQVTLMGNMFKNATSFNGDISNWNTGEVNIMYAMFQNATVFNQDISGWNVSQVTNMGWMFRDATNFNQAVQNWDVSNVTTANEMLMGTAFSTENYNQLLINWSQLPLQNNVSFGTSAAFCIGENAKQHITTTFAWTITDGGKNCDPYFVTKWETTTANESITIPTTGDGYDYIVDWGDGTTETGLTGSATHIYTTPGEHEIVIGGSFPRIHFNNGGDKSKITEVMRWGTNSWKSMERAFYGCGNLAITATDAPDLTLVINMSLMFRNATSITDGFSNWDVSTIEDMSLLFRGCENFNSDISSWNVSNVNSFATLFFGASNFNQDISGWDVSGVSQMRTMFDGASAFNQDLSAWDISSLTDANEIFKNSGLSTENYDAILKGWATLDTAAGETAIPNGILFGAGNTQYCEAEFERYQLINTYGWTITDGGKATDCTNNFITLWETTTANESITIPTTGSGYDYVVDWGDGTVEGDFTGDATHTYTTAGMHTISIIGNFPRIYFDFDSDGDRLKIKEVSQWGPNPWTSMHRAFSGCENLQITATDIPNLANATDVSVMFAYCNALTGNATFNQWNMETITNMSFMFLSAVNFDQNLSDWDISSLTDANQMFNNATLSVENYDNTLIGWATLDTNAGETQIPTGINFWGGNSQYCEAELERFELIDTYNWTITDGGKDANCTNSFISIWETTTANESITIPTTGTGYNYLVNWGDGVTESGFTGDATHTYATAGTYTVSITGNFPRIYFNFEGDRNKIKEITQWGPNPWTTMENAFGRCENLDVTATDAPNLANVTSTKNMFASCLNLIGNPSFNTWDVSTIEDMTNMFSSTNNFNQDLDTWDVSNVTLMSNMFSSASVFNGNIGTWNTEEVTDMNSMFFGCEAFTGVGGLNSWDVSKVEEMNSMFRDASIFNQDLDNWNVTNVREMNGMFLGASQFNGNISTWNVSNLEDIEQMFYDAKDFNSDISQWNISTNITSLSDVFRGAESFNRNINSWDVSNVTNMINIFNGAISFNQPLDNWDTSSVGKGYRMFYNATSFNQSLGSWDLSGFDGVFDFGMGEMLENSGISTENYDATLIGWASLDIGETAVPSNVQFGAGSTQYCNAELQRFELINTFSWNFTDGGKATDCNNSFISIWETTTANESITIPIIGDEGFRYIVDWGDGTTEGPLEDSATHTYTTAGTYTVSIIGTFPRIFFNFEGDRNKIKEITQWGPNPWTTMENAFAGCENLDVTATDAPNLSNATSTSGMFADCTNLAGNTAFNTWDVSTIEDMSHMFANCFIFDTDISNWNVSNVTDMNTMFFWAFDFNQDISSWNVSSVTNMQDVFFTALNFDQDLSSWNVSNVTNMSGMFRNSSFNNDISSWDVSNVEDMKNMFRKTSFNQDIGAWDISSVTSMAGMFNDATLSTENYDATLIGWATLDAGEIQIPTNVTFDGGNSTYCVSETERQELIDLGWTITDGGLDAACGDVMLAAKVCLQGAALNPNVGEENLMRDDLRIAGLIPTRSPYADMISCDATVFNTTGNDAIVDWVWVEIRDENNNATVVSSQSALLQRDGDIVSTDGASALSFEVSSGNYYISVQHRNHLGIMSANTMALNATATTVDFTSAATTPTFGSNAQTSFGVPTGTVAMWTGNVNSDSIIQYSGTNPDTPDILSEALNDPGNFLNFPTFAVGGYRNYDINMDGITQYSGTNPDTPFILQNVLAHPGNFLNFSTYQIQEQLPQN